MTIYSICVLINIKVQIELLNNLFNIKFINKIFLVVILLISTTTYSQTVLLNQNPTNAFVGPAASCNNSTPGDPTSNTFPFSADTDCYESVDVSISLIPENPNNAALIPGFEAGDRVEITPYR